MTLFRGIIYVRNISLLLYKQSFFNFCAIEIMKSIYLYTEQFPEISKYKITKKVEYSFYSAHCREYLTIYSMMLDTTFIEVQYDRIQICLFSYCYRTKYLFVNFKTKVFT